MRDPTECVTRVTRFPKVKTRHVQSLISSPLTPFPARTVSPPRRAPPTPSSSFPAHSSARQRAQLLSLLSISPILNRRPTPTSTYPLSPRDRSRSYLHEFHQPDQPREIECSQSVITIRISRNYADATAVEVRLKPGSTARIDTLRKNVKQHLELDAAIYLPSEITGWQSNSILREHVEAIYACESSCVCHFTFAFYV